MRLLLLGQLLLVHFLSVPAHGKPPLVAVEDEREDAYDLHAELVRPLHRIIAGVRLSRTFAVEGAFLFPGLCLVFGELLLAAYRLNRLVDDSPAIFVIRTA